MSTIYLPWRCYAPTPGGHPGWLFEGPDCWYAGSLDMPPRTEPNWLPNKRTFERREDALEWFGRGETVDGPDVDHPSPYCAVYSWRLEHADLVAGIAAHEAAGVRGVWDFESNNCWHGAFQVLCAIAGGPGLGPPTQIEFPWQKPDRCVGACNRP